MNAACNVAKTISDVEALCKTRAGAVLVGSITCEPRTINPGPNLQIEDLYMLNSFGMPNEGMEAYTTLLPIMVQQINAVGKKSVLSIAGFNVSEFKQLGALGNAVDLLELNFGCPNVHDKKVSTEIMSFNITLIEQAIMAVQQVTKTPLLIKLSPYSNPYQLIKVAELLARLKVAAVVTSNTFPNGVFQPLDMVDAGYGGISGKALMPIALGQVHQFRKALPPQIAVIGVGGIETKEDVSLFLAAGASMVEVATLIVRDGHHAINQLIES